MMLPTLGRRYQIDYLCGLRYVFSPAYRIKVHNTWCRNAGSTLLYMLAGVVGTVVVILALLLLVLAIQGLLR